MIASGWGDGFLPIIQSFAVLQVTGSVSKLGLVLACQGAIALLLTLIGGIAGDRFPRGRILIVSLVVRMTVATTLAVTLLTGTATFALLFGMAAAYGCADGFFGPVSIALLPDVVPKEKLASANALVGGISSSSTIAAPAIAGVMVAAFGPGVGFVLQAAVLALAASCLTAARLKTRNPISSAGQPNPLHQLRDGWSEFARLRWLWLLTGEWAVFSLLILAPIAVLGPAIARNYLGGASAWGVISSCLALGAVGGQFVAARLRLTRSAYAVACLVPLMTVEAFALGLGAPVAVVAPAAAFTGLAMGIQAVIFQTAMQTTVPAALLARVSAFDLLGSESGQPIGYALAGPIGLAIGPHTFLTVSASGVFLVAIAYTFLPSLRRQVVAHQSP